MSYPKRAYSLWALSFVTGDYLPGLKRQGFEVGHLTQTSVEFKGTWSFNSTNPICFLECTGTFTFNFVIRALLGQSLSPSAPSVSHQQFYFSPAVSLTLGSVFRNVWVSVCGGVLVICILVFTVFCIVCTVFLNCFVYVYLFLFVLSVLV